DAGAQRILLRRHRTGHVGGGIPAGDGPWHETLAACDAPDHAIDSEGAPVASVAVPAQQVPTGAGTDQGVRLDHALAASAVLALVAELDADLVAARAGQRAQ